MKLPQPLASTLGMGVSRDSCRILKGQLPPWPGEETKLEMDKFPRGPLQSRLQPQASLQESEGKLL